MFIKRTQADSIKESANQFKVVGVIGPRQSGKTTLVRWLFKNYDYINLENIDDREFAQKDPRAFLNQFEKGLIIDEFQHVPDLLSYIQARVDEYKKPGMYILTGSQNFLMNQAISQSLAGRVALHTLLPLSIKELLQAKLLPKTEDELMYKGFYPSLYEAEISIEKWYAGYMSTYLERDVRQLSQVADLSLFRKFMQLCAGRIGQVVNFTSLANDCGISDKTARGWLSILEASYILYVLQPHYKNFSKRLIKSPKIYFYDTGLASYLLRIKPEQMSTHYLNGGLFETMIISDLFKSYYNRGIVPRIYFWRDRTGREIDCILDEGVDLVPIEVKRGHTINQSFFKNLTFWNELSDTDPEKNYIVYGGDVQQQRSKGSVLGWRKTDAIVAKLYD
jgi:hypothetical protein